MKTILNKQTTLPISAEKTATYADLLIAALNRPSKGMTITEMRRDFKLIDLFEKAEPDAEIEVEPGTVEYLATLVEGTTWNINDRQILEFADYLNEIK